MMQILVGRATELPPGLDATLARYRHKIFVEQLGWQLPIGFAGRGSERDQFDRSDTIYIVARSSEGAICGCARLLPTTRPYLLGEVFPHLMSGQSVVSAPDVWELSRFAALAEVPDFKAIDGGASNARVLLAAAVEWAARHRVRRLIGATYVSMERFFRRLGVHAHRAGPPAITDGEAVCACWIEIDEQTLQALNVEVGDAFLKPLATQWPQ